MKKQLPNLLGAVVRDYFTDHLSRLRGASPHTIHSYRDSLVLLLRCLSAAGPPGSGTRLDGFGSTRNPCVSLLSGAGA